MKIFLLIFSLGYVLPIILSFIVHNYNDEFGLDSKGKKLIFIPFFSFIFLFIFIVEYIKEFWEWMDDWEVSDAIENRIDKSIEFLTEFFHDPFGIKRRRDRRIKRMKILAEREEKIKKGIIRISPIDPYGEENWAEEDRTNGSIVVLPQTRPLRYAVRGMDYRDHYRNIDIYTRVVPPSLVLDHLERIRENLEALNLNVNVNVVNHNPETQETTDEYDD